MLTEKAAEKVLREYETQVLDVHHLTLPFEGRDRPTAIYAILAQHDSYAAVELLAGVQRPDMSYAQTMKSAEEGVSQGLRWLHDGSIQIDPIPTTDWELIGEAGEYVRYAKTYVDLADMHKMYGRKQVLIEVDDAARQVKFSFQQDDLTSVEGYIEAAYRWGRSPLISDPQQMAKLFRSLEAKAAEIPYHLDLESGRIVFDDIRCPQRSSDPGDDEAHRALGRTASPSRDGFARLLGRSVRAVLRVDPPVEFLRNVPLHLDHCDGQASTK